VNPGERALTHPLTHNVREDRRPTDLAAYEASGGYRALRETIGQRSPEDCLQIVKDSGLRGRGGAGFPTGMKWQFVPRGDAAGPGHRYLICNADEMEPGTFKDRLLMECDPHQLIEGMILAAYTIGADRAYIFIRNEYRLAAQLLREAIAAAGSRGYLGEHILGSDFSLDMHVHVSAGRYICGEETALINSLEGRRAIPRAKPPFPQVSGLWGRPTIVNNVETLCNVSHILAHGAQWFQDLGHGDEAGTKLYGVSGRARNPGCWERPIGTSAREIIEDLAGGMRDGYRLRGFLPGGGSTDFLVEEHLDIPLDYSAVAAAGSRLGTGTMILLDDRTCPVGFVHNLTAFFAQESCGFCTPCRDGLPWTTALLADIEAGRGREGDLDILAYQTEFIGTPGNTHCALAPGAMEPVQSALKYFRDDFEDHLRRGACPYASKESA
jgi:NADH-quinone oxidoreductase subunit F